MKKNMIILRMVTWSVAMGTTVIILAACGAQSTPQLTPSETLVPDTSTAVPTTVVPTSTNIPTETATPTPELGPEERATSIDQVVGRWAFRTAGGGENDPAVLTLAEDGTTSMDGVGGYHAGMNLGVGTFRFEDDVLILESDQCTSIKVMFFTCTAKYKAFVSMGDDGPGKLKLVAIEDPHPDRKQSLNNKSLWPASE
jgi:ABC-type transport system substrate-binding protein